MRNKTGGIYLIVNIINDKIYVGSGVYFDRRFGQHRHDLKKNSHDNKYLQAAWNKYGENNFIFVKLIMLPPVLELHLEQEKKWIKLLDSCNRELGYNLRENPNSNLGYKFSDEFKANISKTHLGRKRPPFSDETRRRMSEAQKGKKLSEEHKAKFNRKGKRHSQESKDKLSKARTGVSIHTEESKAKISAKNKGSKRSLETKLKMSAMRHGRRLSEETKAKMREAHRKRLNKN